MRRYVCIHGHFYQPPREDPWTGKIAEDKSSSPYHDWNERITAECYAPNAHSTPYGEGSSRAVNNYSWISFDFGPTLLRWMETEHPETLKAIADADRTSRDLFGGHGSAMAQVYNHMIMPLASDEDKKVQTKWGVSDFQRRFGRYPEGMWLPETAADVPSLEALAEAGIKFTVLAPHQALGVRRQGSGEWADVSGGRVDTRKGYYLKLPSGRSINIFFFDRALSNGLAFGGVLSSGESFSSALLGGFTGEGTQLVNIATDGETFGHHKKGGDSALTTCILRLNGGGSASLTNYGQFLSAFPPEDEVRIAERASWSCAHGVERWRSNCGCGSDIRPGYNQEWRSPLRTSMNWLAARLFEVYNREGTEVFEDPAGARDGFPSVNTGSRAEVMRYADGVVKAGQSTERGVGLLAMVQCSAAMLASCAWFWEDMCRTETVQSLRFAARGMELARGLSGLDFEPDFRRMLSTAVPNDRRFASGGDVLDQLARSGRGH
jgi:alpha-amylase/alpha-mannosidase (GH57 family)